MALEESAVSELLDALRVGEGADLIRELAGWALQQLIEAEAAETIGAGRFERSVERTTHRNGYRRRVLSTKAGDLPISLSISPFFLPFASSRPMKSTISRAVSSLRCRFSITWSASL